MKENIEQMRARHKEEMSVLQWDCKHEKISDWKEYQPILGHTMGHVKCCKNCGKIIEQSPTREEMRVVIGKPFQLHTKAKL